MNLGFIWIIFYFTYIITKLGFPWMYNWIGWKKSVKQTELGYPLYKPVEYKPVEYKPVEYKAYILLKYISRTVQESSAYGSMNTDIYVGGYEVNVVNMVLNWLKIKGVMYVMDDSYIKIKRNIHEGRIIND